MYNNLDLQHIQNKVKIILKDMGLSGFSYTEKLKLDSLDSFELITNLEEEFNIDINDNELLRCTSFNNIVLLIHEKLIKKKF